MEFVKAEKWKAKLRAALFGPPGSGKTMSALRIATGMKKKGEIIAFIDSEHKTASKYADRYDFDVLDLEKTTIDDYIEAINVAAKEEYPILIIDSLSHAWQELLGQVNKYAKNKFGGNNWAAWSEGTPMQRNLIAAIVSYPGHIIATMRSAIEWVQQEGANGNKRPVKVAMKAEQGKGIEYEFDLLIELNQEHYATITKDRTGKFQDKEIMKPGEEFGKKLIAWLNDGKKPEPIGEDTLSPAGEKEEPKKPPTTEKRSETDIKRLQITKLVKAKLGKNAQVKEMKELIADLVFESTGLENITSTLALEGENLDKVNAFTIKTLTEPEKPAEGKKA